MGQAKGEERFHRAPAANKERYAYCIVCNSVTRTRKEFGGSVIKHRKEKEDIQRRSPAGQRRGAKH